MVFTHWTNPPAQCHWSQIQDLKGDEENLVPPNLWDLFFGLDSCMCRLVVINCWWWFLLFTAVLWFISLSLYSLDKSFQTGHWGFTCPSSMSSRRNQSLRSPGEAQVTISSHFPRIGVTLGLWAFMLTHGSFAQIRNRNSHDAMGQHYGFSCQLAGPCWWTWRWFPDGPSPEAGRHSAIPQEADGNSFWTWTEYIM